MNDVQWRFQLHFNFTSVFIITESLIVHSHLEPPPPQKKKKTHETTRFRWTKGQVALDPKSQENIVDTEEVFT